MIQITAATMKNAVAKARAEAKNYIVRRTNAVRSYRIENKTNGNIYNVHLYRGLDGNRYGACDCKAGQAARFACKHIAQAVAYNAYLVESGQIGSPAVSVVA